MKVIRPRLKERPMKVIDKLSFNHQELITLDEFEKQASKVERVTICIGNQLADNLMNDIKKLNPNLKTSIMVTEYPYKEMMPGDCTVDDLLQKRVIPHVNSNSFIAVYYGNPNLN